ncbi:NB-ARC domain-containing protein [Amycolatopsis sp.]|uniref:NB-ARC domain-containing protein n=1 Tax=Amycolatopsis sp. TaxID=37632 RepID=UPI002C7E0F36|nr:NB-ARC domain-containing protein [Amycolatopsis sp.]HVV10790.1 NB-ARC domain-containing protein [Amycolatopsis sp.]
MSDQGNRVDGRVTGSVVQAGAVHGDVHVHVGGPEPPVPRQLPPPPHRFVNRGAELSTLDACRSGVVVLRGQGGVGKTALALYWLNTVVERFTDGQLYADLSLSTGEPVAPEVILGRFLRALGVPPRQVPEELAERTTLYRTLTAGKALAVLLDDVVSAAQARVLLPASPRSVTVVTSRHSLVGLAASGAHTVIVEPLDAPAALELLSDRIGQGRVEAERLPAEELAEFCAGLPIALCVAAARAAARPKRSLARIVSELADERARLDALSAEGDLSVRSTLDVAYTGLSDELRRVYRAVGLHPGAVFGLPVVAAMIDGDPRDTKRALDALVDASLAEEIAEDYYRLHDLVRVHALEQAAEDRVETVHRALQWYLFAAALANGIVMPARTILSQEFAGNFVPPEEFDTYSGALDWLERHRPILLDAAKDAINRGWPRLAYRLADALQPLLILHKHRADTLASTELGLQAAVAAEDSDAETRMRKRLARVHIDQGHLDRAEEQTEKLLRDSPSRRDEAGALKTRGFLHARRGRLGEAARDFAGTAEILRELGRRRGEGLVLVNLGETLLELGRAQEALEHLGRARSLLAALDEPDPYNEARAAVALGRAYLECDAHAEAQALLEHGLTVFAEQGSDYERSRTHRALAESARRRGDADQARRHDDLAEMLRANSAG